MCWLSVRRWMGWGNWQMVVKCWHRAPLDQHSQIYSQLSDQIQQQHLKESKSNINYCVGKIMALLQTFNLLLQTMNENHSPSASTITMVVVAFVPLATSVPLYRVKPSEFSGMPSKRIVNETCWVLSSGWKVTVWVWKVKSSPAVALSIPLTKGTICTVTESVRSAKTSSISGISYIVSMSGSANSYVDWRNPTLAAAWKKWVAK